MYKIALALVATICAVPKSHAMNNCIKSLVLPLCTKTKDSLSALEREEITKILVGDKPLKQAHISTDIDHISDRLSVSKELIETKEMPFYACLPHFNTIFVKTNDWKKGSRFYNILPAISHEISHIDNKDMVDAESEQSREVEKRADIEYALKSGIAGNAAQFFSKEARKMGMLHFDVQPDDTHPPLLERAVYMANLHRKNRCNPTYIDGRYWKLDFVINSYVRQEQYESGKAGLVARLFTKPFKMRSETEKKYGQIIQTIQALKKIPNLAVSLDGYFKNEKNIMQALQKMSDQESTILAKELRTNSLALARIDEYNADEIYSIILKK
jgi:hypothetical protein